MAKTTNAIRADKRKPRIHTGKYWDNPDLRDLYFTRSAAFISNEYSNAGKRVGEMVVKYNFTTKHLFVFLTVSGIVFSIRPLGASEVVDLGSHLQITLRDYVVGPFPEHLMPIATSKF